MLIGLIGAGGLVGQVVIRCLQESLKFNSDFISFKFFTKSTNLDKEYMIHGKNVVIEKFLMSKILDYNFDYIILATDNDISAEIIDCATLCELKTKFIDLSSEFRLKDNVPLVIPEVNSEDLISDKKIIASPNCTTTFLVMLLKALEPLGLIKKVIVSTYQSASGAGQKGLDELELQAKEWISYHSFDKLTTTFWKKPLLFNVFSHNSAMNPNLYNQEEMKIIKETQKILSRPDLKIVPTCVRVPVLTSHCESINVEFNTTVNYANIIDAIKKFPGIKIMDDLNLYSFPEPVKCSGLNDIYVGRIRPDLNSLDLYDNTCWNFFLCGDQLIKGSGLNAVQILEKLIK